MLLILIVLYIVLWLIVWLWLPLLLLPMLSLPHPFVATEVSESCVLCMLVMLVVRVLLFFVVCTGVVVGCGVGCAVDFSHGVVVVDWCY